MSLARESAGTPLVPAGRGSKNNIPPLLPKSNVIGIPVTRAEYDQVVPWIMDCARRQLSVQGTCAAVHNLVTARQDPAHDAALRRFHLVTPDGQPVRWALNWFREKGEPRLKDRVYGPNLTLKLCEAAAHEGLPVYFFGSSSAVLEKLLENLSRRYPSLKPSGHAPGSISLATYDPASDLARIRKVSPSLLFIGLGCPKQESWINAFGPQLSCPTLGVGAAFDFLAGTLAQAPAWIQRAGLEWAYRFACEPRRLWKRYLYGNIRFLVYSASSIKRSH